MGNPVSRGQQRDKPYRDALRIEAALAEQGEPTPAKKGSLRWIARRQLELAGEAPIAAKEIADRLDGKVPQAIVGDDEHDPLRFDVLTDEQRAKALEVFLAKTKTEA